MHLGHFVVERDLLVGWGLIGGEDATNDVGARRGATHIGKLLVPEGFDDVVEFGGRVDGEAPEKQSTRFQKQRF